MSGNPRTEQEHSGDAATSSRRKKEDMHRNCTTYQVNNNQNDRRQGVHFTHINALNKNLSPSFKGDRHSNPHHDTIHVVDMECAHQIHFQFFQTRNSCVICSDAVLKSCLKGVIPKRDKADTYRKRNVQVLCSPHFRTADDALWKELTVSIMLLLSGQANLKEYVLGATWTFQTDCKITFNQRAQQLEDIGNFENVEKIDSSRFLHLTMWQRKNVAGARTLVHSSTVQVKAPVCCVGLVLPVWF